MRQRLVTVERLESIARNAILGGYGQLVPWRDGSDAVHRVVRLTLNMDCDDPYGFELHARWSAFKGRKVDPFTIVGFARCRKCRPCKVRRRMFWAARAHTEYNRAVATMMVTFTTTLDQDFAWDQVLRSRYAHKWVDFDKDLSEPEKFTARASIFGEEITKYIKRLRKGDSDHPKPALRYLLIAEAHDSDATSVEKRGRPHFHMLLHQQLGGALVLGDPLAALAAGQDGEWERRYEKNRFGEWKPFVFARDEAFVRTQWELGFTKVKLCFDANSAVYLCKYLSKSLEVRVRASQRYGLEEDIKHNGTDVTGSERSQNRSVSLDPRARRGRRSERSEW